MLLAAFLRNINSWRANVVAKWKMLKDRIAAEVRYMDGTLGLLHHQGDGDTKECSEESRNIDDVEWNFTKVSSYV